MKRLVSILILFVFLGKALFAAEEITLTLDDAVALALRDNREILFGAEEVKKAKEKIAESRGGLLPTLNFTGSWTETRGFYQKDIAAVKTQTTLKQYLYAGGKVVNTIKFNESGLTVAQALLDKTKLETVLSVQKAFFTFALAREFADLNKEILDNIKAHLSVQEARFLRGEASESDILNIKKSLSDIEEVYLLSLNDIEAALSLLKNLLYLEGSVKIIPEGKFAYEPKEVAFDEAFLKTIEKRPEIRQYEAQTKQAKSAVEIAKSGGRPNVYASWDYYSNSISQLTFSPSKSWNDHNIVGLTFSWPVFDGWATKHKVEQAIVELRQAELLKQKLIKDIALELKEAYLSLKDAVAGIKAAESQFLVYEDNLSVIKEKHKNGIASLLDLSDASLSHSVSQFNKMQAIYDYIIAKCNFDKATGGF